jgi:molecular chaperone HscB
MDELHELSSSITRAYDVLSGPHSRAEHLLELNGATITENCTALVDATLLMEVMEIREEIDNASDDAEILRTLLAQNEERIERVVMLLREAFDRRDDMEEARRLTAQLQYWKRIEEKVVDKLSTVK